LDSNHIPSCTSGTPGTLVSSTNKTDRHDIAEILLKGTLNTISPPPYALSSLRGIPLNKLYKGGGDMVFNVPFNNISAISWRSVLLVEETRVPGVPDVHEGIWILFTIFTLYTV
jgi:hypothetical protein